MFSSESTLGSIEQTISLGTDTNGLLFVMMALPLAKDKFYVCWSRQGDRATSAVVRVGFRVLSVSTMSSETEPQLFDSGQKVAFQMRRNQILEDIYDAYINKTPQLDPEVGEALKQEFNDLSYQLECLYNGPMTDPLRFLPAELWMEIIRDATKGVGITK
jgi:hypothetical protein